MKNPKRGVGAVVVVVVAVVVVVVTPADAADDKRRVLVADAVNNGVDANLTKTLTSMLVNRLDARAGIDALSGAELRQLMSLQADKAACGSDDCVNDLTGALGAPLAVFSDVGKLGTLVVVNLTLFDVVKGEPAGRASVETEKLEELPGKLDKAVDSLLASAPSSSTGADTGRLLGAPAAPAPTGLAVSGRGQGGAGGGGVTSGGLGKAGPIGGSGKGGYGSGASSKAARSRGGGAREGAPAAPPAPPPPSGGGGDELADLLGGKLRLKAKAAAEPSGGGAEEKLTAADVKNVVGKHLAELRACGDKAATKGKGGIVKVRFLIAADGKVTFAHVVDTELKGTGVPKCVIDNVALWTFPATGSPTTITYPFKFD